MTINCLIKHFNCKHFGTVAQFQRLFSFFKLIYVDFPFQQNHLTAVFLNNVNANQIIVKKLIDFKAIRYNNRSYNMLYFNC